MTASLIVHAGARRVEVAELAALPLPTSAGRRHTPIAHAALVDLLREKTDKAGFEFRREEHALSPDSSTYFGVFDLQSGGDWTVSLGLRNNHTRRMSAAMCYGQRVFVCDNLAFTGDHEVFRRHTSQILRDLAEQIEEALKRVEPERESFERRVKLYSATPMDGHGFTRLARELVKAESIPATAWPEVLTEWADADKYGAHGWGFYNAITQVLTPRGDRPVLPAYAERTAGVTAVFDAFAGMTN